MDVSMCKTLIIMFVSLYMVNSAKDCAEKSQEAQLPKGITEIPVVLMVATLGSEVMLPCRYCSTNPDITGRIWRRRNLHGSIKDVELDMHDDDDKNRVFVDKEHSLIVRRVQKTDAAYYFCYGVENGTMKMELLLDVVARSTLEPNVLESPVDLKTAVPPLLKTCQKLKSIQFLKDFQCYSEWSPWSRCDVCDKVGKRRKIGRCRLQKLVKAKMENPKGKEIEAEFPIVGVACHSYLLESVKDAKEILDKIPDMILIEKCEVSCENYIETATAMTAHQMNSFLKKVKFKKMKQMKGVSSSTVFEELQEKEGKNLALFCPGATIDTPVRWKINNKVVNPQKIKDKTRGRISIDLAYTLHIKNARVKDSGEYICTLYSIEIGIIRVKVTSIFVPFDFTTNFGALTLSLAASFLLYIGIVSIKVRSYMIQKKMQRLRRERGKLEEYDETDDLLYDREYS